MKKQLLSTLLLSGICASFINAQTYQQITGTPFTSGANPSMEFFDKDNDGDKDVMICAYDHTVSAPFSRLYENDGTGNFTLVTGPFEGINLGDLSIGDIDGDNDLDMVIIGKNAAGNSSTKVYLNNGTGVYSIKPGTGLPNIGAGCAELGDLDGDGDLDLYIDGSTAASYPFVYYSGLFINDGAGNFTQNTSNTFVSRLQSTKLVDLDNDGYLDIVSSGYVNTGGGYGTDFYKNNGNLNFSAGVSLNLYGGEIGLIDVNNDNAMDMIIGGTENGTSNKVVDVFINNGSASFTKVNGNSFGQFNDIYFSANDFDGNGTKDLTLVGWQSSGGGHIAKQYLNNGSGVFTENTNATFTGVRNGNVISTDINGNGSLEILIVGYTNSGNIAELYQDAVHVCTVDIPDANFKSYLVGNSAINTNGNTEIECTEADAYIYNISCANSSISDLTGLEAFTNITSLSCNGNSIDTLDISQHLALTSVFCHNNSMERLILGQNSAITTLYADQNNFTEIALSGLTALQNIRLNQTSLNAIDLTQNTLLEEIEITQTNIDTINFNQNTLLETVHISGNIQHLDLSNNGNLTLLAFNNSNTLHSLNLKNGNNTNLTYLGLASHSNLNCIEVDNPTYSYSNWNNASFSMPNNVSYSTDCATFSSIKNIEEQKTTIYPNPTNGIVNFSSNENISSIEIYSVTGQKVDEFNNVKTIDISSLPKGVYTAKIITGSSNPVIERLIKN